MAMLHIIIVGYNEEVNLPKCFESLKHFYGKLDHNIHYIDQSSGDKSVEIAKRNLAKTYIHENKGYADPDKKRASENLVKSGEWCLILDADEEVSSQLANEITEHIIEDQIGGGKILIDTFYLGISLGPVYQNRFFKHGFVLITDEIHNYTRVQKGTIMKKFDSMIINNDLKIRGSETEALIKKLNAYTNQESEKNQHISKIECLFKMIFMPIYWFLVWGVKRKVLFRGIKGWIYVFYMMVYQFTIYVKIYENKRTHTK